MPRRTLNRSISGDCWGGLSEVLSSDLRRRLVLCGDADQPVWVAGGNEDERRDTVQWLHENGRTHLGRMIELEADDLGEGLEDWVALQKVLRGPNCEGSDVSAVCIHDADRLSPGSLRLILGALDDIESCDEGFGAPRLFATSQLGRDELGPGGTHELQNLLMRLDVLHIELPDPLADLGPSRATTNTTTVVPPTRRSLRR